MEPVLLAGGSGVAHMSKPCHFPGTAFKSADHFAGPANFMPQAVSFASNNKGFTGTCSWGSAMLRNSAAPRKSMTSIVETTAAPQYFQITQKHGCGGASRAPAS